MRFIKACKGKKFIMTAVGSQQYQVVGKYSYDTPEKIRNQYKKCVPEKWYKEGWVVEVNDDSNQ